MESSLTSQQVQDTKNEEEKKNEDRSPYREMISTFPRGYGWNFTDYLYQYQGFWSYPDFLQGIMSAQYHFKAQPNYTFIASFLKTGTTWLKALAFSILTRTQFDGSTNPLLVKGPHDCIPFLEVDLAGSSGDDQRGLEIPLVATHMPYDSLPRSITDCGCRIVYIWRDPKDVFVSMWHFLDRINKSRNLEPPPLEKAFEMFCEGVVCYGPYWNHLLGYWKASLESPEKVLFLKFEEMKKETASHVKKIAEFMGNPFTQEEEEKGVVQKIISTCDFESLSNLEVNKKGQHRKDTALAVPNNVYFRKGDAGDWANHLTAEMGARLDSIMAQKLEGSGLTIHPQC